MRPLIGALVYPTIDTAGQVIEPDFHSGLTAINYFHTIVN